MAALRILDLYCKAGGCSVGYARAATALGLVVSIVGVDKEPQPRYPFEFVHADVFDWLERERESFDFIHASPPCQFATAYRRVGNVRESPNLIPPTRDALQEIGTPYVIENVEYARDELDAPILICGSMFDPPLDVQRHRLFESSLPLEPPAWPCRHRLWAPDRFPGGRSRERTGTSTGLVRGTVEVGSWDIPLARQQEAMGIDWMRLPELSEAIPPAFTEHIGRQLFPQIVGD
jgi:DNA (cytosine-5)-methyltransferase 1